MAGSYEGSSEGTDFVKGGNFCSFLLKYQCVFERGCQFLGIWSDGDRWVDEWMSMDRLWNTTKKKKRPEKIQFQCHAVHQFLITLVPWN